MVLFPNSCDELKIISIGLDVPLTTVTACLLFATEGSRLRKWQRT